MPALRYGQALLEDLENLTIVSHPLIEDFLYTPKVTMLAAEPGMGKSLIATQIALSLSSATPCFGMLPVKRPARVYYLQLEGDYEEFIERMRLMRQVVPLNADNLCWDTTSVLNVLKPDHADAVFKRIKKWGSPDLIILDPIYRAVGGGLSKDEPASAFVQFSSQMKEQFKCAQLLLHHTHRANKDREGRVIEEDDPFYGSQWLKAHVDVSYLLKAENTDHSTSSLNNKKSRGANVLKYISLEYHPESMTCSMRFNPGEGDALTRILTYLNFCKQSGKDTDFYQIATACSISHAHLRRHCDNPQLLEKVELINRRPNKTIWRPK